MAALLALALAVAGIGALYAPEPIPALVAPGKIQGEPTIRVLVVSAASHAACYLAGDADLEVVLSDGARQALVASSGEFQILPTASGVRFDGRSAEVRRLRITPRGGRPIRLRWIENDFDSVFELFSPFECYRVNPPAAAAGAPPRAVAPGGLRIVTRLGLEAYLAGVLPNEVRPNWPADALKAQAVAARTFALYHIQTRRADDYDVSLIAQEWKPASAHTLTTRQAVEWTTGMALLERGGLFPAYFAAECGGQTTPVRHYIALTEPVAALAGVRCPRCSGSIKDEMPYAWKWSIGPDELARQLSPRLRPPIPPGQSIVAVEAYDDRITTGPTRARPLTDRQGRASVVVVRLRNRNEYSIPAAEFRLAVGSDRDRLASTWFRARKDADGRFVFEGKGRGHGVGLCQMGMRYLAAVEGRRFEDILKWYYPGATLATLYNRN